MTARLLGLLAVTALGDTAPRPEAAPPAPAIGVLQPSPALAPALASAGVSLVVLGVSWGRFEPAAGATDRDYIRRLRDDLAAYRRAGLRVVLDPGFQYPPDWLFDLPDSHYQNQYGSAFDDRRSGMHVANSVFNAAVRARQAAHLAALFRELGADFFAVRLGGGWFNELNYPPSAYHKNANCYWAFDALAQGLRPGLPTGVTACPVPGWKPGDVSPAHASARRWIDWYLASLQNYHDWQIAAVRHFYAGPLMMMYPSWGIRPGQLDAAVAGDLSGDTPPEKNGEIPRGFDFARFIGGIRDPLVWVHCTWLDANPSWSDDTSSDPARWSPVHYLSALARHNTPALAVSAENTGGGGPEILGLCAERSRAYDLKTMFWAFAPDLFDGHPPELKDLRPAFSEPQVERVIPKALSRNLAPSPHDSAPAPLSQTYEAETGLLLGQTRLARENHNGTVCTFVTGFEHPGDGLAITIKTPSAGFYFLDLGYACGGDKRIPVSVNGRAQGSRFFPKTTGFAEARYGRVFLDAGTNTIRIGTDWTFIDVDFIRLSPADAPAPFHLSTAPVNLRASLEARQLFTTLTREFGHRTIAGQYDANPGTLPRLKNIASLTDGAAPALLGLDLLYYSGTWNHPEGDSAIETARDWALRNHGIVTLSWHWFSPGGSREPVWDSFSTLKTLFDVDRLANPSTPEYHAVIADLDRIAEKLKILRDARIPVLWRPLHEAEGQWFWWGARGPAATKRLYRLMFDRFTRVHHLDNLLWVWTSTDSPAALDWYPGDDLVDIIATDLYAPTGMTGDYFATFDGLRELYAGRKPLALGECGALPTLTPAAPWLWFLCWDDFITRPDTNPATTITNTYASPGVMTLSRLPP